MPNVLPFCGLRFDPAVVGDLASVVCPPYDVIAPAEQAELLDRSPYNVVGTELPSDRPGAPGSRYEQAANGLRDWVRRGVLKREERAAYYLHRTRFPYRDGTLERHDLIAALEVRPWSDGAVLPHEHTMAGPKADRLALMRTTHANVSPIWVLYRERPEPVVRAWAWAESTPPAVTFALGDEGHDLWVLDDRAQVEAIREAFAAAPPLYIADGHHRFETALAYRREAEDGLPGARDTLAVVSWAEDPGLVVLPTHRMLAELPEGMTIESLEVQWSDAFHAEYYDVWEDAPAEQVDALVRQVEEQGKLAPAFGALGPQADLFAILELRGGKVPVGALPADRSDAWKELDVAILHSLLIDPLLGDIPRPRDEVLSFTRDAREAFAKVRSREAAMAFFLNSTKVAQVLAVADAGDLMPEKSTYFYPKPPTGLVIRDIERP